MNDQDQDQVDFLALLSSLEILNEEVTINDVVIGMLLSLTLSLLIAVVYRNTYKGVAYNQSFVQTMIMMSMLVSIVMLVIGSNIARAFSLVGAMSIIRFRKAMRNSRDVGFIFLAIAVGMAAGTRFYLLATVATLVICGILVVMSRLNMYGQSGGQQSLILRLPADTAYETLLAPVFARYLGRFKLITAQPAGGGRFTELTYDVKLKREDEAQAFTRELSRLNGNNKVSLTTDHEENGLA